MWDEEKEKMYNRNLLRYREDGESSVVFSAITYKSPGTSRDTNYPLK